MESVQTRSASRRGFLAGVATLIAGTLTACDEEGEDLPTDPRFLEEEVLCEEENPLWALEDHDWDGIDPIDPEPDLEELVEEFEPAEGSSEPAVAPASRKTYVLRLGHGSEIYIEVDQPPTGADFDATISSNSSGRTRRMKMRGRWTGRRFIYTGIDTCDGVVIKLTLGFGRPRLGCSVVIGGREYFRNQLSPR
ncbi:MAG: hypothetical protein AAF721_13450 [Myxococcota bacterium]